MREFHYIIRDEQGIHARPAGFLVKEASKYPCSVTIAKNGKEVDAKRILGIMGIGVKCGEEVTVKTDGECEDEAMEALMAFFEKNL